MRPIMTLLHLPVENYRVNKFRWILPKYESFVNKVNFKCRWHLQNCASGRLLPIGQSPGKHEPLIIISHFSFEEKPWNLAFIIPSWSLVNTPRQTHSFDLVSCSGYCWDGEFAKTTHLMLKWDNTKLRNFSSIPIIPQDFFLRVLCFHLRRRSNKLTTQNNK